MNHEPISCIYYYFSCSTDFRRQSDNNCKLFDTFCGRPASQALDKHAGEVELIDINKFNN
jgi:hypothetical protein